VSLERYGVSSVPRLIDAHQGLALTESGQFTLPAMTNCGGGFGSECRDARIRVFVDSHGDLVAMNDRGDAGVLTLLPEGLVGRMIAIFPRIRT
jgi:hypothetical protein